MGIGAQSGTINVVIDVRGQGDGAAVVDKNAKALKGLKEEATGLKGIGESLKGATSGINSLGGGLAGVRMGMMGIPGAVAGMGAAVIGFVASLNDAFSVDRVREFHDEFKRDIAGLEKATASLVAKLGEAGATIRSLGTEEVEAWGKLNEKHAQAEAALSQIATRYEAMPGFVQATYDMLGGQREREDEIHKIKVEDLQIRTMAREIEFSVRGITAEQLTNRILQAEAARTLNERLEITVQKSWALLAPLKAAGGALGVVGALGAGPGINDAVNKELLKPRGGGGGGGTKKGGGVSDKDLEKILSDWKDEDIAGVEHTIQVMRQKEDRGIEEKQKEGVERATADSQWEDINRMWSAEEADARAQGIRDISSAIMESIPALDKYAASLGQITDVWAEYGKTSQNMGAAVTTTVGNLAKVGAQQIKDERARAGVLAAINFGLFLASEFVPGMQPMASGYLASSIALGIVAATGIGTGGGASGGGAGAARNTPRTSLVRNNSGGGQSNGPIVLNIGVLAGGSPQENAESIGRILDRRRAA
jgi:hypothetical protein